MSSESNGAEYASAVRKRIAEVLRPRLTGVAGFQGFAVDFAGIRIAGHLIAFRSASDTPHHEILPEVCAYFVQKINK